MGGKSSKRVGPVQCVIPLLFHGTSHVNVITVDHTRSFCQRQNLDRQRATSSARTPSLVSSSLARDSSSRHLISSQSRFRSRSKRSSRPPISTPRSGGGWRKTAAVRVSSRWNGCFRAVRPEARKRQL